MTAQPGRPSSATIQPVAPVSHYRSAIKALLVLFQVMDHADGELRLQKPPFIAFSQGLLHVAPVLHQDILAVSTTAAVVVTRRTPTIEAALVRTLVQGLSTNRASVPRGTRDPTQLRSVPASAETRPSPVSPCPGGRVDPFHALIWQWRNRHFTHAHVRGFLSDDSIWQHKTPFR